MTTLNFISSQEEKTLSIVKDNKIFIQNKLEYFRFFNSFYQVLKLKRKEVRIVLDKKTIDSKNTILLSLCDFSEILENLEWKKGSLFYEYVSFIINDLNCLDNDMLLYDMENIIKNILNQSKLNIDYEIEEDIEKHILNLTQFQLHYDINDLLVIITKLFKNYIEKNLTKNFVIFYDSELLPLDFSMYDSCYSFDVSKNIDFENYNLICEKEMKEFDLEIINNKLESIWPIDYKRSIIMIYIREYFIKSSSNMVFVAHNEQEYLTYLLMDKIYDNNSKIEYQDFVISDNVKSFLKKI